MSDQIHEKIKALSKEYSLQLPNKIKEIESSWLSIKLHNDQTQLEPFMRKSHTLCGTAGTYGYKLISEVACNLETSARQLFETGLTAELKSHIDNLIIDLKQLLLNQPEAQLTPELELTKLSEEEIRSIYILDKNIKTMRAKADQIEQFNYIIRLYDDNAEFIERVQHDKPDMVLLDIALAKEIRANVLKKFRDELILIIYTDESDELESRLFTIRHFGQAFIVKPFDVNALLRIMDNLFEARQSRNERLLVVDDSESLADYYTTILEHTGFVTAKVTDPKSFLMTLLEFQPDLILMDINMPFCSGLELAQVVQQQETLSSVPIVFLSTIAERSKQLEVLSLAGDDFLTKPVEPKHLLSTVRNRLMRSRILRSRMMRDSLTNLYNHTMIHNQLERECVIAQRYNRELSVVLLDIDYFKKVNDTYGHQAGDIVLKNLSAFLHKNLRANDLIGRYGGEEFLIILPDTNVKAALKLVNKLRSTFAQTPHTVDGKTIYVTLSGGIASYPKTKDTSKLIKKADDALYVAKEKGRNQIVLEGE